MARHAYRYSSGQETGFLVVFMVLAALIFLAVILSPVQAVSTSVRADGGSPGGGSPVLEEIPVPPGSSQGEMPLAKPKYYIKIE